MDIVLFLGLSPAEPPIHMHHSYMDKHTIHGHTHKDYYIYVESQRSEYNL